MFGRYADTRLRISLGAFTRALETTPGYLHGLVQSVGCNRDAQTHKRHTDFEVSGKRWAVS